MKKLICPLILPLAFLLCAGFMGEKSRAGDLELIAQSARRAALQCYAIEGAYPESAAQLERYGFSGGGDWVLHYGYAAANLMPHIEVLEGQ